ncbi:hypothetical protein F7734_17490 [Scytonema sp. UIC 10036]|nr:hypothetical protein [Scytonema sp. UIC 10036]MUG94086.1 hypothetical protein [Scytonema sp. UIC 10036]
MQDFTEQLELEAKKLEEDYFMGTGKMAGDRAGVTGGNGELYYLLLKE